MAPRAFFHQADAGYSAQDLRRMLATIIPYDSDGVVTDGLTITNDSADIYVSAGTCLFGDGTDEGMFGFHNDASAAVYDTNGSQTWSPAGVGSSKTDTVYAKIVDNSVDGGTTQVRFEYTSGTLPDRVCVLGTVYSAGGDWSGATITDLRNVYRPWNTAWGLLGTDTEAADQSAPTTSGNLVSVSVTVPAGRALEISGFMISRLGDWTSPVIARGFIYKGASEFQNIGVHYKQADSSGDRELVDYQVLSGSIIDTPSAGTYTYSLRAGSNQSSNHIIKGTEGKTVIVVKDVGPA